MRTSSLLTLMILIFTAISLYGQEKEIRHVHIGIIYPLSTNGITAAEYQNRFSLHAIGGISGGELGICISGFGHITGGDQEGIQMSGVGNFILGDVQGASIAGLGNATGNARGVQVAGLGNISSNMRGIQVAGLGNIAMETEGLQVAGFGNISHSSKGLQIAGFGNVSRKIDGIQTAGFFNAATDVEGIQVAGFLNIARNVKGIQVAGLINIADSSDFPIGIVNIIGNGAMYIQAYTDEIQNLLVSFRSGGKNTYGFIGAGVNIRPEISSNTDYATELGIGLQMHLAERTRIRAELFSNQIIHHSFSGSTNRTGVRLLGDINFGSFHVFGGFGMSLVFTPVAEFEHPWMIGNLFSGSAYLLPGLSAGIAGRIK